MTRTINLKFVILTNELKFETLEYLELLFRNLFHGNRWRSSYTFIIIIQFFEIVFKFYKLVNILLAFENVKSGVELMFPKYFAYRKSNFSRKIV